MSMRGARCVKCDAGSYGNPRYIRVSAPGSYDIPEVDYETLEYTCDTCGYKMSAPTADAKKEAVK